MQIRKAELKDKNRVLSLLDEFRSDCIFQITGEITESHSAQTGGASIYEELLTRDDYVMRQKTQKS